MKCHWATQTPPVVPALQIFWPLSPTIGPPATSHPQRMCLTPVFCEALVHSSQADTFMLKCGFPTVLVLINTAIEPAKASKPILNFQTLRLIYYVQNPKG